MPQRQSLLPKDVGNFRAQRPPHRPFFWGLCILLGLLAGSGPALSASAERNPSHQLLQQQRQHYLAAREALRRNQTSSYEKHRQRLHGYPLAIYLDYLELNRRLSRLPQAEVDEFLDRHQGSYLGDKLRRNWLRQLAKKSRWEDYRAYYDPQISYTSLRCQSLQARLETGDRSALAEVEPLWNVHFSQPDECDPLFEHWVRAGQLSQDIAWQRFRKAMNAGERGLASYLSKKLQPPLAARAALLQEVDRYPQRLQRQERFAEQTEAMQDIILHGLGRYARRDPVAALELFQRYDAQQLFADQARLDIQRTLALNLVRKGEREAAHQLLDQVAQINDTQITELLIREALKEQDWQRGYHYIRQLPEEEQLSEGWLYWRARAMEQLQLEDPDYPSPQEIYSQLALQRSFYAFLSADRLGRQYQLGDRPANPPAEVTLAIANHPASRRARELLAVNDQINATREWLHMSRRFQREEEHLAAATLAHQWGWHQKTIMSMASAQYWDDLRLRFPLAYNKQVFTAAQKNQVSPLLLFAIARQESAFAAHARSPAGALGLMQLMPGTARYTARKHGVAYQPRDLLLPEKNIHLGSVYITELLERFGGNRILATAAYNAGPGRVRQWQEASSQQLPYDVWIEVIPFRETRKYVQNVLAYSVIYGYRTGTTPSMLSALESSETL